MFIKVVYEDSRLRQMEVESWEPELGQNVSLLTQVALHICGLSSVSTQLLG